MNCTTLNETTAPKRACMLTIDGEQCTVQFAESTDSKIAGTFTIVGYSGGIIKDHWYWGNVAFDLGGIKFAKTRIPVLEEHSSGNRIGFTTKQEVSEVVSFEGKFLNNSKAQELANDMRDGFPMQASLFIPPSVIEKISEGASVEVNGRTLKGPGTVFRKSTIKEVSMATFGFDEKTRSSAYTDGDNQTVNFSLLKENSMSGTQNTEAQLTAAHYKDLTAETFAKVCPSIHTEIFDQGKATGEKAERDLFAQLKDACGDNHALTVQCFIEGKSVTDALKMRAEQAESRTTKLTSENAKLRAQSVDPAEQEFSDSAPTPGSTAEDQGEGTEASWRLAFAASTDLQAEFRLGGVQAYIEMKKREQAA